MANFSSRLSPLTVSVPVVTDWTSYTPATTGLGTLVSPAIEWKRQGDTLYIRGRATTGTVTAANARIDLPTGLVAGTYASGTSLCGRWVKSTATGSAPKGGVCLITAADSYIEFSYDDYTTADNPMNVSLANSMFGSGDVFSFHAEIKVSGWTANTFAGSNLNAIVNGGNSYGSALTIGTNDAFGLNLETNGTTKLSIDTAGAVTLGPISNINHTLNGILAVGRTQTVADFTQPTTVAIADDTTRSGYIYNPQYTNTGATKGRATIALNTAGNIQAIGTRPSAAAGLSFGVMTTAGDIGKGLITTEYGFIGDTGAWTLGPTTGSSLTHTVRSNGATDLSITSASGSSTILRMYNGAINTWVFVSDATASNGLQVNSNTINAVLTVTQAGAWTLGPASGGAFSHTIRTGNNNTIPDLIVQNTASAGAGIRLTSTAASMDLSHSSGQFYCNGVFGKTSTAGITVLVNASHNWGTTTSIREAKTNIQPLGSTLGWLNQLKTYTYQFRKQVDGQYTDEAEEFVTTGLMYDEVVQVNPGLCFELADGTPSGVEYTRLITPMLRAIQELHAELQAAKAEIEALKNA